MTDPSSMANSYLPTMPDDNLLECIEAIAVGMSRGRPGEWYGECLLAFDQGRTQ